MVTEPNACLYKGKISKKQKTLNKNQSKLEVSIRSKCLSMCNTSSKHAIPLALNAAYVLKLTNKSAGQL